MNTCQINLKIRKWIQIERIGKYYAPIQPGIQSSGERISYQEVKPHDALETCIYCYWQLKTTKLLPTPFIYRVVADGCIDIYFNLNQPEESFVMGFWNRYVEFPLGNSFNFVGIRFYPSILPQWFGIDAKELSNSNHELKNVLPTIAQFLREFTPLDTLHRIGNQLDHFFLTSWTQKKIDYDSRFYDALHLILKNHGATSIEHELKTGLSPRQMRRLFNYYIGTSPKVFSKVVRFQTILNAKPSVQSLRNSKIFYDIGFYDQAHFIKDFKALYGITPTKAFK